MNTFAFNGSVMSNIKESKNGNLVTAKVTDRRVVTQPDGTVKSLFTCSRFVTIFDPTIIKFVKDNLIASNEDEFMVNVSGYLSSSLSQKDKKWYDNQVVTELSLAE